METLPFNNQALSREDYAHSSKEDLLEAVHILRHPYIRELAEKGQISLAMIRPNVGPEANLQGLDDNEAAASIEEQISGLGIVARFSFRFTDESIEQFYEGPSKENMKKEPPREGTNFDSTWSEFKDLMTSGPSTVLLLHNPSGAIPRWRDHLGHWNIEKTRDPSTIRGRMGVDNYNNLVHGSDAPESVLREMNLVANCIESQL